MSPTDLYFDLLKKSLAGTTFTREPDTEQANEMRFVQNS